MTEPCDHGLTRPAATRSAGDRDGTHGRIRVLIVDDHVAVRAGLAGLITGQPDMTLAGEASSAVAAVAGVRCGCDVAIVDYHLGDRNGLWVTRRLRQSQAPAQVLLYSAFAGEALAVAAIVAGAAGLLGKSAIGEEVCLAVRRLAAGGRYLPVIRPAVLELIGARLQPDQRAILGLLVHGIPPGEAAAQLGMSTLELDVERAAILGALVRVPAHSRGFAQAASPLHYDRRRTNFPTDDRRRDTNNHDAGGAGTGGITWR